MNMETHRRVSLAKMAPTMTCPRHLGFVCSGHHIPSSFGVMLLTSLLPNSENYGNLQATTPSNVANHSHLRLTHDCGSLWKY